ncbi:hypothetical protein MKK55_28850 [Methylobacterium sp. J-059]|uniref:hypothetical protein n=1 Tax=Methylobacterium sp. J-059 TaxID=2836643 RepID=UPI001FB96565|nr:hypothetical protein [Methylobacterium sp. J-059]MCJ2042926.1 hypothetical protein [Methylobacterium sp. J-059]
MRDLNRRLARIEEQAAAQTGTALVRMFFEPRPCDDPEAFARQCDAEAGAAQVVVIRFVKPGDVIREGALQ